MHSAESKTLESCHRGRLGFSYLEVQVAFALLAIALSGLGPLVVMHSRQLRKLESRFQPEVDYYVTPSEDDWARKLGAIADLKDTAPALPTPLPPPVDAMIDNLDADFSLIDIGYVDWQLRNHGAALDGQQHKNNGGKIGDSAVWTFDNLPTGDYKVFVTYGSQGSNANNAPYSVFDNTTPLGTILINQKTAPAGNTAFGVSWDELGIFEIESGTLVVKLADYANGNIMADAVRIESYRNKVELLTVTKSITNEVVTVTASVTGAAP